MISRERVSSTTQKRKDTLERQEHGDKGCMDGLLSRCKSCLTWTLSSFHNSNISCYKKLLRHTHIIDKCLNLQNQKVNLKTLQEQEKNR